MSTVWDESSGVFGAGLRVLFVGASSVRTKLFAGVSGESGVDVIATDLAGADAAFERLRPDVLVSDLDSIGEDAFRLVERVRALPEQVGVGVVAIAVGDAPRNEQRVFDAGYEAYCARSSVASEVVELAAGARVSGAARAASFAAKQAELRRVLGERRVQLAKQRSHLAQSAERLNEMSRPLARAHKDASLVRAPSNVLDASANRLLAGLPADDLWHLSPSLTLTRVAAGRTLYMEGGRIDAVYFPLTCVVSQAAVTRDGKIFEAVSVGNEGMVGLGAALDADRSSCWTRVQISGAALRVATPTLRAAIDECPGLRSALLRYARAQIFELTQNVLCNRLHRIDGQLARTLLRMSERVRSLELPLTHERLSEALGTTRPSVTLAAQALEDVGAIVRSYGRIRIVDVGQLRRAACECFETIDEEIVRLAAEPPSRAER